jgi:hypothetical protein
MTATVDRELVTKHSPLQAVSTPSERIFEEQHNAFIDGSGLLSEIAIGLQKRYTSRFEHLGPLAITYLWKATGGKEKGRPRLGSVQKSTDLHRLAMECDVFVWVACDHVREHAMNHFQLEALMFSLLCRIQIDDETSQIQIVAPEFSGFHAELAEYGAWSRDLEVARDTLAQIPLFP